MPEHDSQIPDTIVVEDPLCEDPRIAIATCDESPTMNPELEFDATFFEFPRTTLCPVIRDARIFVIDDEPEIVELIEIFLRDEGHNNVIGITEPVDAVDLIRAGHPDAVILDLQMPRVDGLDILKAIRSDVRLGAIPILVLTADADHESKRAAFELGAADFLTKPIDYTELSARIRNALVVRSHQNSAERHSSNPQPRYCVSSIGDISVNAVMADGSNITQTSGQLYDLSRSGARISLDQQLPADESINLQILAPKVDLDFRMTAIVRWSQPSGTPQWYHGCSFSAELPNEVIDTLVSTGQLDRRRDERTRISLEAHVRQELEFGSTTSVLIEDYSFGGLRVFSPQAMQFGDRFLVEVYSEKHDPIRIPVRPQWQQAVSDGFAIGCSFLSHTAFRQLQQVLDHDEEPICDKLDDVIESSPRFGASLLTWISLVIAYLCGAFTVGLLSQFLQ